MADEPKPGGQAPANPAGGTDEKPKPGTEKPAEKPAAKPAEAPAEKKAEEPAKKETPAEEGRKADEGTPESKAPEKYALTIPKDAENLIDADDLKAIEALARAKGMSNEAAQALVDDHADALADQSAAFRAQIETDPTYGGDKLEETQKLATRALDKVRPAGTPRGDAFRKMLTKTGYGNNLEVVSLLADLGRMMGEDTPIAGSVTASGAKPKDPASVLYGEPAKV